MFENEIKCRMHMKSYSTVGYHSILRKLHIAAYTCSHSYSISYSRTPYIQKVRSSLGNTVRPHLTFKKIYVLKIMYRPDWLSSSGRERLLMSKKAPEISRQQRRVPAQWGHRGEL